MWQERRGNRSGGCFEDLWRVQVEQVGKWPQLKETNVWQRRGGGVVRQGTGLSLGGCRVEQAGHQGKGTEGRRDVLIF